MLAATFIATFLIPMFYRLIAWKQPKTREEEDDDVLLARAQETPAA
jgi:multidrug efflux pump